MGKVLHIRKSRKEHKCNKCGTVIPVGSEYYKGEINFGPTIIRCVSCKLFAWEVTTSEWQRSVGAILHSWESSYELNEAGIEELHDEIEQILDDQQERLSNMPENLQDSDTGQLIQERIDACETTMEELDNIEIESLKAAALSDYIDDEDCDTSDNLNYDEVIEKLENEDPVAAADLAATFEELLHDEIEQALSNLEI